MSAGQAGIIALAATLTIAPVAPADASSQRTYSIEPASSELVVRLFKEGLASGFAHHHVVRAVQYRGVINFSADAPASGTAEVVVLLASLVADEPEVRKRYDLEATIDADDRREIQSTMLGEEQLDVARHPQAKLVVTTARHQGGNTYRLSGELTLHGVTRPVTIDCHLEQRGERLRVAGAHRFKQSDFGIEPYSFAFGAVRNQDEVVLLFDLVARATDE